MLELECLKGDAMNDGFRPVGFVVECKQNARGGATNAGDPLQMRAGRVLRSDVLWNEAGRKIVMADDEIVSFRPAASAAIAQVDSTSLDERHSVEMPVCAIAPNPSDVVHLILIRLCSRLLDAELPSAQIRLTLLHVAGCGFEVFSSEMISAQNEGLSTIGYDIAYGIGYGIGYRIGYGLG